MVNRQYRQEWSQQHSSAPETCLEITCPCELITQGVLNQHLAMHTYEPNNLPGAPAVEATVAPRRLRQAFRPGSCEVAGREEQSVSKAAELLVNLNSASQEAQEEQSVIKAAELLWWWCLTVLESTTNDHSTSKCTALILSLAGCTSHVLPREKRKCATVF